MAISAILKFSNCFIFFGIALKAFNISLKSEPLYIMHKVLEIITFFNNLGEHDLMFRISENVTPFDHMT